MFFKGISFKLRTISFYFHFLLSYLILDLCFKNLVSFMVLNVDLIQFLLYLFMIWSHVLRSWTRHQWFKCVTLLLELRHEKFSFGISDQVCNKPGCTRGLQFRIQEEKGRYVVNIYSGQLCSNLAADQGLYFLICKKEGFSWCSTFVKRT